MSTEATSPETTYALSNSAAEGRQRLSALENYLDPLTTAVLEGVDIPPGARVLELGPGGGSVARWLAGRIGPTGKLVAVDLDPSKLDPPPGMELHQHDLKRGLPDAVTGPFDIIHARLVLVHIENRWALLDKLVEMLAPGGWIVIGEFSGHPLVVYTAASEDDAALFTTVLDRFRQALVQRHGVDIDWAHRLHGAMAQAGLHHIKTVEHAESWTGGEPGNELHVANMSQLKDRLGLSGSELDRFHELMDDPAFAARSWQFVCTRGQKPHPPIKD